MYDYYEVPLPEEETPRDSSAPSGMSKEMMQEQYKAFLDLPHKPDDVLIEDEFGRMVWVARGSTEHMKNIGSSYRIRNELTNASDSASKGKNDKTAMSSRCEYGWPMFLEAARVKMTWEHQLVGSERDYFEEIDVGLHVNGMQRFVVKGCT